jgi:hypothetical protein
MNTYILIYFIFTNNPFRPFDPVATEFSSKTACEIALSELKKHKPKGNPYCTPGFENDEGKK